MALELDRLIKKAAHMNITLVAGGKGIHNIVSWTHMVETREASSFLEGGEIAFSTGIGLNNGLRLLELAEAIYKNHAAGLIINVGPFIETIPQEVIDFGNTHDFPVFSVPWKIHLAEIMRIFSYAITKSDQKNIEIASAFTNAVFFPKQEELYIVALSQRGFRVNWNYSVCVILLCSSQKAVSTRLEKLSTSLDIYLQHQYSDFAIFPHDTELITVFANYEEKKTHTFISAMLEQLQKLLLKDENIFPGVGRQTKSIRCLYKSYSQAKAIQKLQRNRKIDDSLIFYSDMGIYKLLMSIDDREILEEYYEKTIIPLSDYDSRNDSDLTAVLRCYLKHNGSVQETAEELFVHRNTINYKLNKIEALLHTDLSSLDSRLKLNIGFMLENML